VKFSAQEEYGLRCLIQIAQKGPGGSVTIPEMGRMEGLSATHVAKLLMILRKEGFIASTRGQTGGYALARSADKILVGDVLAALGGRLYDEEFCGKHTGQLGICRHSVDCGVRSLWNTIQDSVDKVLEGLTLADLMAQPRDLISVQVSALARMD
jgi:Rrf2 family protein